MSSDERYRLRQKKSAHLLEEFHRWLLKHSGQVPPKTLIGKAIGYTLRQWERLTGYLKDGILSIDNNATENAIRPFVLGRKKLTFCRNTRRCRSHRDSLQYHKDSQGQWSGAICLSEVHIF